MSAAYLRNAILNGWAKFDNETVPVELDALACNFRWKRSGTVVNQRRPECADDRRMHDR